MLENLIDSLIWLAEKTAQSFHFFNRAVFGKYYFEEIAPIYFWFWFLFIGLTVVFVDPV